MKDIVIYTSPRACSTACHIALEESGLDYEYRLVRLRKGENRQPDYLAVNPTGKLPALRVGDSVLTETTADLALALLLGEAQCLFAIAEGDEHRPRQGPVETQRNGRGVRGAERVRDLGDERR